MILKDRVDNEIHIGDKVYFLSWAGYRSIPFMNVGRVVGIREVYNSWSDEYHYSLSIKANKEECKRDVPYIATVRNFSNVLVA